MRLLHLLFVIIVFMERFNEFKNNWEYVQAVNKLPPTYETFPSSFKIPQLVPDYYTHEQLMKQLQNYDHVEEKMKDQYKRLHGKDMMR